MVVLQHCASNTKLVVLSRPVTNTGLVKGKGHYSWMQLALATSFYSRIKDAALQETTRGQSTTRQMNQVLSSLIVAVKSQKETEKLNNKV